MSIDLNMSEIIGMYVTITQANGTAHSGYVKAAGPKVVVLTAAGPNEDVRPGFDVPSPALTGATIRKGTAPAVKRTAVKAAAKPAAKKPAKAAPAKRVAKSA